MARGDSRRSSELGAGAGPPPTVVLDQTFDTDGLYPLRAAVAAHAADLGLGAERLAGLVVVVSELATNAIRHGGGRGRLRMWRAGDTLYCRVTDTGPGIGDPASAGVRQVPLSSEHGRGLWIVRRLSDHLHIATDDGGTAITVGITDVAAAEAVRRGRPDPATDPV